MEERIIEDKKTNQAKVQYGVTATIAKKYLRSKEVYERFYKFSTLTFNAVNVYHNTDLTTLAQKYMEVVRCFAGDIKEMKNNLDKMNASLKYEIRKVQKKVHIDQ